MAGIHEHESELVGYWKLDETTGSVLDSSVNGNTGTNNGATRGVDGQVGNAYDFDGINDFVSVSDSNILDTGTFTIGFWLNPDAIVTLNVGILQKDVWSIDQVGLTIRFSVDVGGVPDTAISTALLVPGTWTHIGVVHSSTRHQVYVSGSTLNTLASTGIADASASPFIMGHDETSLLHYDGRLDDVHWYRVAFSDLEMLELANPGGPGSDCEVQDYDNLSNVVDGVGAGLIPLIVIFGVIGTLGVAGVFIVRHFRGTGIFLFVASILMAPPIGERADASHVCLSSTGSSVVDPISGFLIGFLFAAGLLFIIVGGLGLIRRRFGA